jgi:hypothetical protein
MDPNANLPHCPSCKGGDTPGHISLQVRCLPGRAADEVDSLLQYAYSMGQLIAECLHTVTVWRPFAGAAWSDTRCINQGAA